MLTVKNADHRGNTSFAITQIWRKWFHKSFIKETKREIETKIRFFPT